MVLSGVLFGRNQEWLMSGKGASKWLSGITQINIKSWLIVLFDCTFHRDLFCCVSSQFSSLSFCVLYIPVMFSCFSVEVENFHQVLRTCGLSSELIQSSLMFLVSTWKSLLIDKCFSLQNPLQTGVCRWGIAVMEYQVLIFCIIDSVIIPPAVLPPVLSAESRVAAHTSTARLPARSTSKTSTALVTSHRESEPAQIETELPTLTAIRWVGSRCNCTCRVVYIQPQHHSISIRDSDEVPPRGFSGYALRNEVIRCTGSGVEQSRLVSTWRSSHSSRLIYAALNRTIHLNQNPVHALLVPYTFFFTKKLTTSSFLK